MKHLEEVRACVNRVYGQMKSYASSFSLPLPTSPNVWIPFVYMDGGTCLWKKQNVANGRSVLFRSETYAAIPPHFHDSPEHIFCRKGKAEFMVQGRLFFLEENDSIVIDAGTLHSAVLLDDTEIMIWWPTQDDDIMVFHAAVPRR